MNSATSLKYQMSSSRNQGFYSNNRQRALKDINQALDFVGLQAGLQNQYKTNDPSMITNIGLNFDTLRENMTESRRQMVNPETRNTGREIVAKNNGISHFIDLNQVAKDRYKKGPFSARSSQNLSKISIISRIDYQLTHNHIDEDSSMEVQRQSQQNMSMMRASNTLEASRIFRKASQSPPRESYSRNPFSLSSSPEAHLAQSRGLKVDTSNQAPQIQNLNLNLRTSSPKSNNGMESLNSSRAYTGGASPYFRYSFRPEARSQSPPANSMNSSTKKMDFKNFVESEIMSVSKGKASAKSKMQTSMKSTTSTTSSQVNSASSKSPLNNLVSPTSGRTSQKSPPKLNYVVVDAEKRFRMANSPKPARPTNKNETKNLKKSLKMMKEMIV